IQVSPADATIAAGTALDYTATGIFSDFSTQDLSSQVTWSSSQSAAAMTGGTATGSAVGSTNISASFGGGIGSTSLTVTDATLTGIEIVAALPVLAAGTSEPVSANGFFSDG